MSVNADQVLASIPRFTHGLTIKQERFVAEYMKDGNATQAAIRAGYKPSSAAQVGYVMLNIERVAQRVEELRAEMRMGTNLTAERIGKELARLAFSRVGQLYNEDGSLKKPHELDEDTAAAVQSVEVDEIGVEGTVIGHTKKIKLHPKMPALELAAKVVGMVRDKPTLNIGHLTIVIED